MAPDLHLSRNVISLGYWMALLSCAACLFYDVAQVLQVVHVLHFPLDEYLIYGSSIFIATPFMLALLVLHHVSAPERRFWSHAGLLCAVLYTALVSTVYISELAALVPLKITAGSATPYIAMLQSVLMASDTLGYVFMSLATALAAGSFARHGLELWLRRWFIAHGLVGLLVLVVLFHQSWLMLGSMWMLTAPMSLWLLACHFRQLTAKLPSR